MTMESTPKNLAERLLLHVAGDTQDPTELVQAADTACQNLQAQLSVYIGPVGTQAVFKRALSLGKKEAPVLIGFELVPEGDMDRCLPEEVQTLNFPQAKNAVLALLSSVFRVLADLLGWNFICAVLSAVWPEFTSVGESSQPTNDL